MTTEKKTEEDEYAFEEYDEQEQEKRAIEERRKRREALQAEYERSKKTDTPSNELTPVVGDIKGKTANNTDTIPAVDYSDKLDRPENKQPQRSDTPDDDNEDDMFALSNEHLTKKQKTTHNTTAGFTADGATDPEGYYATTLGEKLDNGRYLVFAMLGSGMFSTVVRVKDSKADDKEYAVKIIRSQESMYKAAQKEITLLERLKELDEDDKKHVIRLERTFEHRGHLCIVFENLSMNLREILKKFGANVGINIKAVRAYAHQMLLALSLLKKANLMHADLKPDNILVSENKAHLKVCDLGSAADVSEGDITPYLVSRFYRAPEIILGLPYDTAIDMWSIGCTLYEMYTGQILFAGRSNNEMLKKMMELKGKFNHKLIKKGVFGVRKQENHGHFTEHFEFISSEWDKITQQQIEKPIAISKPVKDLRARLIPSINEQKHMKEDEIKSLQSFVDLLDKMLALDPLKRISVKDALSHPFFHTINL
ncbi:kinase-like protein [Wallemia mellicola]|uniref:non-specific serine/threonine protein kinase n=1 Tax=Wallemia mellicola TaxID=1708541 RepID=A0A4T0U321_9BASI|nr:kinase-like protein [Wallemia mellicola]TIC38481.1 kinase-like protein [Wallemia mellicola]TIC70621.1 kinase-like protein [Wallemia mellicola]TIC71965.1 kinase-like protein [Wallemia mellicola]